MKKIIIFSCLIFTSLLQAMEQKKPIIKQKNPSPLTWLAADAYIKYMQRNAQRSEQAMNDIKQELKEKYPLINQEIFALINERCSKNDVYVQQNLREKIVGILPTGHIVTQAYKSNGLIVNFWARYKHHAAQEINDVSSWTHHYSGAAAGLAYCLPAAYHLSRTSFLHDGKWHKVKTLEVPENFYLFYVDDTRLIFGITREDENTGEDIIKKLALFTPSDNSWELDKIFETEHNIMVCTYSEQDNTLVCVTKDNDIFSWCYNGECKQWREIEGIVKKFPGYNIEDIFFLQQSYQEHPLCFLHHKLIDEDENNDNNEMVSSWQFDGKKWAFIENILSAKDLNIYENVHAHRLQVHYEDNDATLKTMIIRESDNRNLRYKKEEFNGHRYFSPDGSLFATMEDAFPIAIFDTATESLIRSVKPNVMRFLKKNCLYFVDNKTMAIPDGKNGILISLDCSTNFALCKHVLQQAQEQRNINLTAFSTSPLVTELKPIEKKQIIVAIEKIQKEQSLHVKMKRLKVKCSLWTHANPLKSLGITIITPSLLYWLTAGLHYRLDPSLQLFGLAKDDPNLRAGIVTGLHLIPALLLWSGLMKYLS